VPKPCTTEYKTPKITPGLSPGKLKRWRLFFAPAPPPEALGVKGRRQVFGLGRLPCTASPFFFSHPSTQGGFNGKFVFLFFVFFFFSPRVVGSGGPPNPNGRTIGREKFPRPRPVFVPPRTPTVLFFLLGLRHLCDVPGRGKQKEPAKIPGPRLWDRLFYHSFCSDPTFPWSSPGKANPEKTFLF